MTFLAKELAYRAANRLGLTALCRQRDAAPILCFHSVVPEEMAGRVGDSSLHVGLASFQRTIEVVQATYRVIPISELLSRIVDRKSLKGCCAITFDDAYLGTVRWALPALAAAGMPSTLFVVTDAAESPAPFWWDVLGAHGTLASRRNEALTMCEGRTSKVLGGDTGILLSSELMPADWSLLATASRSGLVTIGSHTRSHPNLPVLSDADLAQELQGSRDHLRQRFPCAIDVIAYPYGLVDARVCQAAKASGYQAGLALGRKLATHQSEGLAVPRLNIPANISPNALECWLAGLG